MVRFFRAVTALRPASLAPAECSSRSSSIFMFSPLAAQNWVEPSSYRKAQARPRRARVCGESTMA